MDISVIIPVYNRYADLQHCVTSLLCQVGCRFEIIIVNDAGTDGDYDLFASLSENVTVRNSPTNAGPSSARNIGIIMAKGDYILFLDSDTILPNVNILADFLAFFAEHPDAGTVGGEIRLYFNDQTLVHGQSFWGAGRRKKDVAIPNEPGVWGECDYLATCCCMVPTNLARTIGGFDPYYVFGSEDTDFGYRIRQLGYSNCIAADCAVHHFHSPGGRNVDETYRYHFTTLRFALKHRSIDSLPLLVLRTIFSAILFYLILLPKLIWLLLTGQKLVKENLTGGYLMVKALTRCLGIYGEIRASTGRNFLAPDEILGFERWLKEGKKI